MRLGIFGGTFDPVHFGHLRPVQAIGARLRLDRLIYVPARISPHKQAAPTDPRHRIAMLALALAGQPRCSLSLCELDREGPSFTVDTLRTVSRDEPAAELWLLMGTDALATFDRWREPEEIVRLARLGAFLREPFTGARLRIPAVPGLEERLEVFDAGSVKISATEVREDLERGVGAAGRVPEPVGEYITKQGLYGSGVTRR